MKQIDGLVTKDEMYRLISGFRTRFKISEEAGHEMAKRVAEMPTIEADPVKHGRWEINCDGYYPYCSNCKNEPQGREMTLFCPNCGARMDGDSK